MRNIIAILLLSLSVQCFGQKVMVLDEPTVDKRVELLSIVFRLSGAKEYSLTKFKLYTDKIESHFGIYRNHEVVQLAKELKRKNGVSYDAVMTMAVCLDDGFNPRREFTDKILENRWSKADAEKFVVLLKDFSEKTGYAQFFEENKPLYEDVKQAFYPIYAKLDMSWYAKFFGKEADEKFVIILAPGNGKHNYGPSYVDAEDDREVYAIIGLGVVGKDGLPQYVENDYFPTLVHEFNHSFVNHLTAKNREQFRENGEKIYSLLGDEMKQQAYGSWETVLNEALVRAAVIKYMKDHDFSEKEIELEGNKQMGRSFLWILQLVEELEKYDSQRDVYPTLESYMPELVKAYDGYADYVQVIEDGRPKVISITEFENNSKDVSVDTETITVNFDRPLQGKGFSIYVGRKGKGTFPKLTSVSYSKDNKSVIMGVSLIKNKVYQMVFKGDRFRSAENGIPMKDYEINFTTK